MRFVRYFPLSAFLLFFLFDAVFAQSSFSDISGNPYAENITNLAKIGVINGYDDGTFKPANPVNRAEMLKIIFAAREEDAGTYPGNCFTDVKDELFAPYVCRAKDLGIVQGYPDGFIGQDKLPIWWRL